MGAKKKYLVLKEHHTVEVQVVEERKESQELGAVQMLIAGHARVPHPQILTFWSQHLIYA